MSTFKDTLADLTAALTAQTLGGVLLDEGKNLFAGEFFPAGTSQKPALSVTLAPISGFSPEPFINGASPSSYCRDAVQLTVTSPPGKDGFGKGWALARGIAGYLHCRALSGYVGIFCTDVVSSDGVDDVGRNVFSAVIQLEYIG